MPNFEANNTYFLAIAGLAEAQKVLRHFEESDVEMLSLEQVAELMVDNFVKPEDASQFGSKVAELDKRFRVIEGEYVELWDDYRGLKKKYKKLKRTKPSKSSDSNLMKDLKQALKDLKEFHDVRSFTHFVSEVSTDLDTTFSEFKSIDSNIEDVRADLKRLTKEHVTSYKELVLKVDKTISKVQELDSIKEELLLPDHLAEKLEVWMRNIEGQINERLDTMTADLAGVKSKYNSNVAVASENKRQKERITELEERLEAHLDHFTSVMEAVGSDYKKLSDKVDALDELKSDALVSTKVDEWLRETSVQVNKRFAIMSKDFVEFKSWTEIEVDSLKDSTQTVTSDLAFRLNSLIEDLRSTSHVPEQSLTSPVTLDLILNKLAEFTSNLAEFREANLTSFEELSDKLDNLKQRLHIAESDIQNFIELKSTSNDGVLTYES
jgi:hypothetical protein